MKNIVTKIEDGQILISLRNEFYEKKAVFSAAHKLTDRFAMLIEPLDDKTVGVFFQTKKGSVQSEQELQEAALEFCNEVLDQQVRLDIEAKYGSIRDMIVKQAFAPVSLSELSSTLEKSNISEG